MLLDLWTFSSVLNDVLDLVTHLRDNGTFSFGLLICIVVFTLITYVAWRSTDIPGDVPSAPAPPFVITIQNSSNVGGLRRQNLSDIRVISPATYTDFVAGLSRHPFASGLIRAQAIRRAQAHSASVQGNQDGASIRHTTTRVQQQQPAGRSFILGFLRHPLAVTRGWVPAVPARFVLSLLPPSVVTGRLLRIQHEQRQRHQLRQQNQTHPERPQSPTPESPENQTAVTASNSLTTSQTSIEHSQPQSSTGTAVLNSTVNESSGNSAETEREVTTQENNLDDLRLLQTTPMDSENNRVHVRDLTTDRTDNIGSILEGNIDDTKTQDAQESVTTDTNPHDAPSADTPPSSDSLPEVKFTLKFLNDTQIEVNTHSGERIGDFKRRHFARELSENKVVRLIFNGRVLDQDNRTLQECGIFDHCVVHCLVVTPQHTAASQPVGGPASTGFGGRNSNNRAGQRGPEPGMFFVSFVGIILMFMWFVCINFGNHLFTQSAVVSLSILTVMFVAGIFTFYAPFQQQNNNNVNVNVN